MSPQVLDASAMMAFLENAPGADKVAALLKRAAERRRFLLMSVVNWGEVYSSIWRTRGETVANEKVRQISQLPIELIDVDQETARLAASFKARYKLPYVDAFAAALASLRHARVVTSDADFKSVQAKFNILWIA